MDLRTSIVFLTIFGQCINVLNYKNKYMKIIYLGLVEKLFSSTFLILNSCKSAAFFRQNHRRVLPFQLSSEYELETRRGEQRYIPFK